MRYTIENESSYMISIHVCTGKDMSAREKRLIYSCKQRMYVCSEVVKKISDISVKM